MTASVAEIHYFIGDTLSGRSSGVPARTAAAGSGELLVSQRPKWLEAARTRLQTFTHLPQNWDSYGSQPLSWATARHAAQLLSQLGGFGLPAPRLVPTAQGGVQFEWDVGGIQLELELEPGGGMLAVFDDIHQGESWDRELPPRDLAPISEALSRVVSAGRQVLDV